MAKSEDIAAAKAVLGVIEAEGVGEEAAGMQATDAGEIQSSEDLAGEGDLPFAPEDVAQALGSTVEAAEEQGRENAIAEVQGVVSLIEAEGVGEEAAGMQATDEKGIAQQVLDYLGSVDWDTAGNVLNVLNTLPAEDRLRGTKKEIVELPGEVPPHPLDEAEAEVEVEAEAEPLAPEPIAEELGTESKGQEVADEIATRATITAMSQEAIEKEAAETAKVQAEIDKADKLYEDALKKKGAFSPDDSRWWNNRSTGQKIAAIFAVSVNAWAEGYKGKLGISSVLQQILDAVEKDVTSQKEQVQSQFESARDYASYVRDKVSFNMQRVLNQLSLKMKKKELSIFDEKTLLDFKSKGQDIQNAIMNNKLTRAQIKKLEGETNAKLLAAQSLDENITLKGIPKNLAEYPTEFSLNQGGVAYQYYATSETQLEELRKAKTAQDTLAKQKTWIQSMLKDYKLGQKEDHLTIMDRLSTHPLIPWTRDKAMNIKLVQDLMSKSMAIVLAGGGRTVQTDFDMAKELVGDVMKTTEYYSETSERNLDSLVQYGTNAIEAKKENVLLGYRPPGGTPKHMAKEMEKKRQRKKAKAKAKAAKENKR